MPDGIGPHEGRELELILAGQKPLAMFSDVVPASFDMNLDDFFPYIDMGKIIHFEETYHPLQSDRYPMRYVYFALAGEGWRIEEMRNINRALFERGEEATDEVESRIGYLLGYSREQIAVFLAWRRQRSKRA